MGGWRSGFYVARSFHGLLVGIAKNAVGAGRSIAQCGVVEFAIGTIGHGHRAVKRTCGVFSGTLRPRAWQGLEGGIRRRVAEGVGAGLHAAKVNVAGILIGASNASGPHK